jgi:NADPH:quinone reductase-like Zn-dependent oxidoreductase
MPRPTSGALDLDDRPSRTPESEDLTMRALWLTKTGGISAFELREQADPLPSAFQVRIRAHAIGLNFADVLASQGLYPGAPQAPCVLGYEAAGVVDALGEAVDRSLMGKRVIAMVPSGGHADTVIAKTDEIFQMPASMSFEEGAAFPVNWLTAYRMLFDVAHVRPGESMLVHMAAGGVGIAVLQLCRTMKGLVTFGTASAAKHDVLREYGCTYPIDYHTTDYAEEIGRITGRKGVDVVLDPLGGDDTRKGLKLLRSGGRMICYGFANLLHGEKRSFLRVAGQIRKLCKFSPLDLMAKNKTVAGFHLGRMFGASEMHASEMGEILRLYEAGAVKPRIDIAMPLTQAHEAFRRMVDGKNVGKIVLVA